MAKKKKDRDLLDAESSYDKLFDGLTQEMGRAFPGQVFTGVEAEQLLICLPVPALSIRYLLQQEGWPLGRFTMIVGEQESCKSALSYEIARWHRLQQGRATYLDTENKPSPELMWSIVQYDKQAIDYHKAKTLDQWQEAMTRWMAALKGRMDGVGDKPGFGRIAPYCFVVDSLTAALADKTHTNIADEGHTKKRFADEASSLTDYIKYITKEIDGYPFSFIGINHLKPGQTPTGIPTRNIGGGRALRFHQATEFEMRRKSSINPTTKAGAATRLIDGRRTEVIDIQIAVTKNSNAPHRFVDVEMLWYTDFDTTDSRVIVDSQTGTQRTVSGHPQRTYFDWHSTSVEILLDLQKDRGNRASKLLNDLFYIEGNDDRRHCWCKDLGVNEKSKISWAEMGQVLEDRLATDHALADALYPLLGIRRRPMYQSGTDYRDLMRASISQMAAAVPTADGPPAEE